MALTLRLDAGDRAFLEAPSIGRATRSRIRTRCDVPARCIRRAWQVYCRDYDAGAVSAAFTEVA
jgi:hypothetical protein